MHGVDRPLVFAKKDLALAYRGQWIYAYWFEQSYLATKLYL